MATTYNNLYLDTRARLKKAGIEAAQLEARELVCYASDKSREQLYRDMRTVFEPLSGWRVNIITAMQEFERVYGKRADKRRKLSNGGMTCTLYQYMPPRTPR